MHIVIENYVIKIEKNVNKNMYTGTCTSDSTLPILYGDTPIEIINQAEEIIHGSNKNESHHD